MPPHGGIIIGMTDNRTKTHEDELIEMYRNGDKTAAFEGLIRMHKDYIAKTAHSLRRPDHLEDLITEGELALMEAVETFDESSGYRLLTYAGSRIRRAMQKYLEVCHPVRIADTTFRRLVSKDAEVTKGAVSLDVSSDGCLSKPLMAEVLQERSAETDAVSRIENVSVRKLLRVLDTAEKEAITLRYGIGRAERTVEEIARMMGMTEGETNLILLSAMRKMQAFRDS